MTDVDLSEFVRENKRPGYTCTFRNLVDGLDSGDRDRLVAAMQSPDIQHTAIARVVTGWVDEKVSDQTIARHRRGDCVTCAKDPA